MIDIRLKIQEFLESSETEVLEFKEAKKDFDFRKLGKYFSALSNEANLLSQKEAWLIFGIKDDKTIVGTNYRNSNETLQSLKNELANKTSNRLTFKEIYETTFNEKRVLLFQIPSAPVGLPVSFEGHYYGRDGESLNALNIEEIILLDKVQKGYKVSANEAKILKNKDLIEGKRPNLYISSDVAKVTNQEDEYIKLRGINDDYAKKLMIEYLLKFHKAKKVDFEKLLLDKLPDILDIQKKKNKIKNYLQALKKEGYIDNIGKEWRLSKR